MSDKRGKVTISMLNFPSIKLATQALAERVTSTLNEAISERGRASIAVSGGRTPRLVFQHMRQHKVSWDRVIVTLTDERWVTPDRAESNERLVRKHLLIGPAKAATFVPMFGGESSPHSGQAACEQRLSSIGMPLDAVYLGMGADGHIASLFPGHPAVNIRSSLCVAVSAPEIHPPRMSLTGAAIMGAGRIFLLFAGADKLSAYMKAQQEGTCRELPLRILFGKSQAPVEVLAAP